MANYFITYDLRQGATQADYKKVEDAIRSVDSQAVKLLYTVWYAKSGLGIEGVKNIVGAKIDQNDRLLVIESTAGISKGLDNQSWEIVRKRWGT
jgi:hypothetical protein